MSISELKSAVSRDEQKMHVFLGELSCVEIVEVRVAEVRSAPECRDRVALLKNP